MEPPVEEGLTTAFHLSAVLENPKKYKISTVDNWGERVVVGGTDGSLHIFEGDKDMVVFQQIKAEENFSKKPIEQVAVVDLPEGQTILLCLTDGLLRIHDLPSLAPRATQITERTRGCYLFSLSWGGLGGYTQAPAAAAATGREAKQEDGGGGGGGGSTVHLAVATRGKKVFAFAWDCVRGDFTPTHELMLPDTVRTMDWAGASLCLGFKREYNLVHVPSGQMMDLCSVGRKTGPCVTLLPEKELLLSQDQQGLVYGFDGKRVRGRDGGVWSEPPVALVYSHPYVLGLLATRLEVRHLPTQTLVQTLPVRDMRWLSKNGPVFVASPTSLRVLVPVPLPAQAEAMLKAQRFKEALAIVAASQDAQWEGGREEKERRKQQITTLYAYHAFNKGDYQHSLQHFQQSDAHPLQVLSLFPLVIPSRHSYGPVRHPVEVKRPAGEDAKKALSALIPYLSHIRSRLMLSSGDDAPSPSSGAVAGGGGGGDSGEMDLATLVDTALLKAYINVDRSLVMPLLLSRNFCDMEEAQSLLRQFQLLPELICLYKGRGLHRNALELLANQGQKGDPLGGLFGPTETVKYLQELSQQANTDQEAMRLVLDYSKWVFDMEPHEAMRIFTFAHTRKPGAPHVETLPPAVVLAHLKKVNNGAFHCITFLESLINNTGETSPVFHNDLVFLYLDAVLTALRKQEEEEASGSAPAPAAGPHLHSMGPPGTNPGDLALYRGKLLDMLTNSPHYTPEKMLSRFPQDQLLEERAILLSRNNRHIDALTIYAHRLRDPAMAEQYCMRFRDADAETESDTATQALAAGAGAGAGAAPGGGSEAERKMFLNLLHVYLRPSPDLRPPVSPQLEPALALLRRHFDKFEPSEALALLPPETPLSSLRDFLSAVMSRQRHTRRGDQVVKQLMRAEALKYRLEWLQERSKRITVDMHTLCKSCHKKIGSSAFARYPNGDLLHYVCHVGLEGTGGGGGTSGLTHHARSHTAVPVQLSPLSDLP